ncbi:hypothetical protein OG21DRAFT_857505 [Imleria badia]|nr:hypothetical protein OG21DRAFT_857505 [Imleria badia]
MRFFAISFVLFTAAAGVFASPVIRRQSDSTPTSTPNSSTEGGSVGGDSTPVGNA